ncbi:T9SS type A sorting domain-containing protein, partial [candidate division WOR-3 bacterium]|nr:T9SS type A sorting domain-containing protein [candidate division WOR-3 bacterium]
NSGNIYVTGESVGSGTEYDYATIKYAQVGVEESGSNKQKTRLEIYPNPFITSTSIHLSSKEQTAKDMELQIYDVSGRRVRDFILYPSSFILGATWDGRDEVGNVVPPGIYFLKLNGKPVGKVVKVR